MLLSITTTHQPATDLGYLLHKHPDRLHTFRLSFGQVHVLFSEATAQRATALLVLDIDPIGLARTVRQPGEEGHYQHVNDRPYVASSILSLAIAQVYGTAMAGRSRDRPGLCDKPIPLTARIAVLPRRDGSGFIERLFAPLGYTVTVEQHALDTHFPDWGDGSYATVQLDGVVRLQDLLAHVYVLVPVLDDGKHHWIGDDEVEKLLRHGEGWLSRHPEREEIIRRYLKRRRQLELAASGRLEPDDGSEVDANLAEQRVSAVVRVLKSSGVKRVLDLGCGDGKLLALLTESPQFTELVGLDVSERMLRLARERLDGLPEPQRARVKLWHGSLMYRDRRLTGYDAATLVDVVEHVDPARLPTVERVVFECARPRVVVMTTPTAELRAWAERVATSAKYGVRFEPVGADGGQLAVFTQKP